MSSFTAPSWDIDASANILCDKFVGGLKSSTLKKANNGKIRRKDDKYCEGLKKKLENNESYPSGGKIQYKNKNNGKLIAKKGKVFNNIVDFHQNSVQHEGKCQNFSRASLVNNCKKQLNKSTKIQRKHDKHCKRLEKKLERSVSYPIGGKVQYKNKNNEKGIGKKGKVYKNVGNFHQNNAEHEGQCPDFSRESLVNNFKKQGNKFPNIQRKHEKHYGELKKNLKSNQSNPTGERLLHMSKSNEKIMVKRDKVSKNIGVSFQNGAQHSEKDHNFSRRSQVNHFKKQGNKFQRKNSENDPDFKNFNIKNSKKRNVFPENNCSKESSVDKKDLFARDSRKQNGEVGSFSNVHSKEPKSNKKRLSDLSNNNHKFKKRKVDNNLSNSQIVVPTFETSQTKTNIPSKKTRKQHLWEENKITSETSSKNFNVMGKNAKEVKKYPDVVGNKPQNGNTKKNKMSHDQSCVMMKSPFFKRRKNMDTSLTLRERMLLQLKSSHFRYINEQLYTSTSQDAVSLFKKNPDLFEVYHDGFKQQVDQWPVNPVDKIIKAIQRKPKDLVVADFGCGDAKIAKSIPNKVHSFDLVALSDEVTVCDMAHTPLENASVDICVFCLSLMGTNLVNYLIEANRVLKVGGTLKIAEVASRFDSVESFIKGVEKYGFTLINKDLTQELFCYLNFKKKAYIQKGKKLPELCLKPCLYKKR